MRGAVFLSFSAPTTRVEAPQAATSAVSAPAFFQQIKYFKQRGVTLNALLLSCMFVSTAPLWGNQKSQVMAVMSELHFFALVLRTTPAKSTLV
jgi:hypothetical protein